MSVYDITMFILILIYWQKIFLETKKCDVLIREWYNLINFIVKNKLYILYETAVGSHMTDDTKKASGRERTKNEINDQFN